MFDPAIVSMRQFPSQQQQPQQSHADIFMPHLNQQQQQQQNLQQQLGGQGLFESKLKNIDFSNRSGGMLGGGGGYGGQHGMNLQNSIINQQQQNSPAQVNSNVQGMLEYLRFHF